jgi:Asp-tRNA(Asn)/Glu-tRNA(Gln) amidotransferase A subunit family amidase
VIDAGAAELARLIREREVSPVEVLAAFRSRPDEVNAIVTVAPDAEERAREAEAAVLRGDELGPLHGVPFTVKDTFDMAGLRTTRGSLLFADHVPAGDAAAVTRLTDAGGIVLGKTNTPEFALWWETDNRVFGPTSNPWATERTSGGSSGGEAAALAAGLTPLGLGSDVGGSIRLPASWCGVVGFKPSHDRIPLDGHWPETLLDFMHAGPMARSVDDVALAFSVLAEGAGNTVSLGREPVIGVALEAFGSLDADVARTLEAAAVALRAAPVELELPDCDLLTRVLYRSRSAAYFAEVVGDRWADLHPLLRARLGGPAPAPDAAAQAERELDNVRGAFAELFAEIDVLVAPTTPSPAGLHGETDRRQMRATIPFDLTGSPAISIPFGRSEEGLPVGVQLVGRHGEDELLLAVARRLEEKAPTSPWPSPRTSGAGRSSPSSA